MAAWHELDCDKSTEWPVPCRENQRHRTLGHCLSHGCETGPCQRRGSTTWNARLAIRLCCVSFEVPAAQCDWAGKKLHSSRLEKLPRRRPAERRRGIHFYRVTLSRQWHQLLREVGHRFGQCDTKAVNRHTNFLNWDAGYFLCGNRLSRTAHDL